jgi:hypothetical protein
MVVTYGNKHTYVGMDIEYTGNGEAKILMTTYIQEALDDFPEDCTKYAKTPASAHLFGVNKDCIKISESHRRLLHGIVAKLIFVTKRARPDTAVPISFLTTRVTKPDRDNWKKLKRMLEYLSGTKDMPLTISTNQMNLIKTWVDTSYASHSHMRSHTGGLIMMGKGALYERCTGQRINTKSSTEAEVVGASDFLPQTIWTRYFIEAQRYKIDESDFYQDNMSAMQLEKNGRASAGQRSQHINIKYFFIKDQIANGECTTGIMIADFFTKPLQGALFEKFRDIIMGITHYSTLIAPTPVEPRSVLNMDVSETKDSTDVTRLDSDLVSEHSPVTRTYSKVVRSQQQKKTDRRSPRKIKRSQTKLRTNK